VCEVRRLTSRLSLIHLPEPKDGSGGKSVVSVRLTSNSSRGGVIFLCSKPDLLGEYCSHLCRNPPKLSVTMSREKGGTKISRGVTSGRGKVQTPGVYLPKS